VDGLIIDPQKDDKQPIWMQILFKVGVPSAIAMYLVYVFASGGMTLLANIDKSQHQHIADTSVQTQILKEIRDSALRAEQSTLRIEIYQRLTCLHTAKTPLDKSTCLSLLR
jgi:hypothetical protein